MRPELRDAYLERLGLEAEPPSVDALQRLHRRQVERVPYETMWIHAGERWTIDLDSAVERIALHRRGGYCFHLNGAFSELLRGWATT
jgi:N-hydroxyarylamine O-acetyltransferase